jgi:hypothetical protein
MLLSSALTACYSAPTCCCSALTACCSASHLLTALTACCSPGPNILSTALQDCCSVSLHAAQYSVLTVRCSDSYTAALLCILPCLPIASQCLPLIQVKSPYMPLSAMPEQPILLSLSDLYVKAPVFCFLCLLFVFAYLLICSPYLCSAHSTYFSGSLSSCLTLKACCSALLVNLQYSSSCCSIFSYYSFALPTAVLFFLIAESDADLFSLSATLFQLQTVPMLSLCLLLCLSLMLLCSQ